MKLVKSLKTKNFFKINLKKNNILVIIIDYNVGTNLNAILKELDILDLGGSHNYMILLLCPYHVAVCFSEALRYHIYNARVVTVKIFHFLI